MEQVATRVKELQIPESRFIKSRDKGLSTNKLREVVHDKEQLAIDMMSDIIHEPPCTNILFRNSEDIDDINKRYSLWVKKTEAILSTLSGQSEAHYDELLEIARDMLDYYTKDPFYVINQINRRVAPENPMYLATHSVNVAIIAMAMGIRSEYGSYQIIELIIGSLLHDLGHTRTSKRHLSTEYLESADISKYDAHVISGVALLKNLTKVPLTTALIVYQHHEYFNGTGRIAKTPPHQIHDFSSIVLIADSFESRCRFHAPNKSLAFFMKEAKRGLYNNKFIPALLSSLSIFPIGTYVLTQRGEICKVVGTRTGSVNAPILASLFKVEDGKLKVLAKQEFYNSHQDNQVAILKTFQNAQLNSKINLGF